MRHKRLRISKSDANNLLDVLQEWEGVMGAKELSVSDVGLDWERYEDLRARLKKFADSKIKDLPKRDFRRVRHRCDLPSGLLHDFRETLRACPFSLGGRYDQDSGIAIRIKLGAVMWRNEGVLIHGRYTNGCRGEPRGSYKFNLWCWVTGHGI